MRSPPRSRIIY